MASELTKKEIEVSLYFKKKKVSKWILKLYWAKFFDSWSFALQRSKCTQVLSCFLANCDEEKG